jgi:hypothetical protein
MRAAIRRFLVIHVIFFGAHRFLSYAPWRAIRALAIARPVTGNKLSRSALCQPAFTRIMSAMLPQFQRSNFSAGPVMSIASKTVLAASALAAGMSPLASTFASAQIGGQGYSDPAYSAQEPYNGQA